VTPAGVRHCLKTVFSHCPNMFGNRLLPHRW